MKFHKNPACIGLVLVLLAAYLPTQIAGSPESIPWFYQQLGLNRSGFFSGAFWQLLSHAMLHATPLHLLANLALLLAFGLPYETGFGPTAMIRIWLAGAVGGGLFHLAFGGNGLLVGASGMVCATILADSASFPHARLPVLRIAAKNLGLGILFASAILTAMTWCQSLPAWLAPASSIGHACHLGGALAGYAVAKIQRTQRR